MISDVVYDLCLPVLKDESAEDEDKTDQLLELLRQETSLTGSSLDNAVLDVLWRFRESAAPSPSPPPARHVVIRRPSPASWQLHRPSTPLASSPVSSFSLVPPPGFSRVRSSTASPFTSPRPSPRMAFASPRIPHSPDLNAYEFPLETGPAADVSGDYGNNVVDWLVNDDAVSIASSAAFTPGSESVFGGVGTAYFQPAQIDMSPYDILRSVVGEDKSDDEIERALEANGYDLTMAIVELMAEHQLAVQQSADVFAGAGGSVLVGKSTAANPMANAPPRSGVVCKYFLSSGACLRADCRFSHDLSNHVCKYWLMGNCLAGDTCVFSHDPSSLINKLSFEDPAVFGDGSPPPHHVRPNFQIQDYNSFPALQQFGSSQFAAGSHRNGLGQAGCSTSAYDGGHQLGTSPGALAHPNLLGDAATRRPRSRSRPASRHSRAATPSIPSVDDPDAFPSLGASGAGSGKKKNNNNNNNNNNHGRRSGHGNGNGNGNGNGPKDKEMSPTMAGVLRMAPSPKPGQGRPTSKAGKRGSSGARENGAAAQRIPAPQHIPWLETGDRADKAYLKARQEAIKHGALRNKFLQSAAQAWHRNDARAAKALSLRGQSENELMRKAHREAARQLHDKRNAKNNSHGMTERYIDLHGLHANEVVGYFEPVLLEYRPKGGAGGDDPSTSPVSSTSSAASTSTSTSPPSPSPSAAAAAKRSTTTPPAKQHVYIITGTAHHSKNGKDKIGKTVRSYLDDLGYAYREFSVPGDRNQCGGILGVDPRSYDREKLRHVGGGGGGGGGGDTGEPGNRADTPRRADNVGRRASSTKVKILTREEVNKNGRAV